MILDQDLDIDLSARRFIGYINKIGLPSRISPMVIILILDGSLIRI